MKKKSTGVKECIFKVFYLLTYFWLCWVFVAVLGLSLVAANGGRMGAALPVVLSFSFWWPLSFWSTGFRVHRLQ